MRPRSEIPPQLNSNIQYSHRFRFLSGTGNSTSITIQRLISMCGVIATTTTTGSAWVGSLRVREVEIWSPPSAQGQAVTCSLEWVAGLGSAGTQEVSDTSMSVARPAHIRTRPPRNSLASFWNNGGNNPQMFVLVAPTGSIVDVTVDLVMFDDEITAPTVVTLTAATVGNVYYMPLDGHGGSFVPVSLTAG